MKESFKPIVIVAFFMAGMSMSITGIFLHDIPDLVAGIIFLLLCWKVWSNVY